MAKICKNIVWVFGLFIFTIAGSTPKMMEEEDYDNNNFNERLENPTERPKAKKDVNILQISGTYPPEVLKALHEAIGKKETISSTLVDKLVPEDNKIIFTIQLREPMTRQDVIQRMSEAVAKNAKLELDSVKVSKYDAYTGTVSMFFVAHAKKGNHTGILKLRPAAEIMERLSTKKRLQNAAGSIKIIDIYDGHDYNQHYSNGKKVSVQSIFSDKNWEAWQLAILISASLFAMFSVFIVVQMFISSHRLTKNKVRPLDEPRHVILQPILRPAVAGVGIIQPPPQPRNLQEVVASGPPAVDTDSENTPSPLRSPLRRGRGLLERRGSNASLTLDLNRSQENICCGTPPKECSAEEYLQSAAKRLTRRQLRASLKDVKALHTEFWEIPMNHPEKVIVAGSGTKNRYKTILPNETSRVQLYEKCDDPLSSYINANYVRGYSGESKAYIATQGPLPHTVNDFWLMVWREKSPLIVMITKLKEKLKVKCEPYIPDYQDRYNDIEVTVTRVIPREGYTVRELFLRRGSETHIVHHFWYTTWPDHKTPATAKQLIGMALETEAMRVGDTGRPKGPMVVHCSAGIGRTGCFIAASIGIQQLLEENSVDVLGIVCSLRLDRGGMIQTAEQYEFVHQALSIFELTMPGKPSGD
ncbi:hypothetical protein JTE90_029376 [Oedothorax gibbosus]|uniref:protein-tyrosine-phosphatase n=1 Tax=Oedothorax gibbosus TaxID=931172 RepID=A0AAV6VR52_9ARAC|nr:hypothetical protein JTE90_029376 [Oedothorax gibbosus]